MSILSIFSRINTPLFLAPQFEVSESPFRRICRRLGADVVLTEFVSADRICRGNRNIRTLQFNEDERPIGAQIFGSDPKIMVDAAKWIEENLAPDFVDINFGCPSKTVVKSNGGSACLRDLDLVSDIIKSVSDSISLPVTVKIRSGWDENSRDPITIALRCQDAGAKFLTLHARSRTQKYGGRANWDEIAKVVESLEIPVIGNGDVKSGEDAKRMKDHTKCAGIMIARGSHGNPWIFGVARNALDGKEKPLPPTVRDKYDVLEEHINYSLEFRENETITMRQIKKHLCWYTNGVRNGKRIREELNTLHSLSAAREILKNFFEEELHPNGNQINLP